MFRLPVLLVAAAATLLAAPALAAPLIIIVPGGYVYESPILPPAGPDYPISRPAPFGAPFDPGRAAVEAMAHVPWAHQARVDLASPILADTLVRTGDSLAEHWLKCQARYATYSLTDDTYTDGGGLPRNCRL